MNGLLLLASVAFADSFLTSVPLPSAAALPTAGACDAAIAAVVTTTDAFEHAMVLADCHGFDPNPTVVAQVRASSGPLHDLDVGWTLMYEATYGGKTSKEADRAIRSALAQRPRDPRVAIVGALVLAQQALFVREGSWDKPTAKTREVAALVRSAAALNRAAPNLAVQQGLDNAIDYLVMYGVFADLVSERGAAAP
jgi:hypothetical protein